jgi:hypothetical protein
VQRLAARYTLAASLLVLVAGGVAGCGLLLEDTRPETVRLEVTLPDGEAATLVASQAFTADFTVDVPVVRVVEGDTLHLDGPLAETYDIERSQRFLARVLVPDSLAGTVRMRAFVDGRDRYDEMATGGDSLLQFIYFYRGSNPPGGGGQL